MSIEVSNIRKAFGSFVALNGVSLKIETGELVALLGPLVRVKPRCFELSRASRFLTRAQFILAAWRRPNAAPRNAA